MTNINTTIADIEAGLEGTTPGRWLTYNNLPHGIKPRIHSGDNGTFIAEVGNADIDRQDDWEADAAHIARCDPDTIRSLIAHIRSLEAERGFLREAVFRYGDRARMSNAMKSELQQAIDAAFAEMKDKADV